MKINNIFESELTDNKVYVNKVYAQGQRNPFGNGVIFSFTDKGVNALIIVELVPKTWGVHISEIRVLEGKVGKGFGSAVMELLVKEADKMNVDLSLYAVPLDHEGKKIPKNKLKTFYKKFGFNNDKGDMMRREPK